MMAENKRYETAKECAGASIEALMTLYWADSFELQRLEARITDLIYFFTRNPRSLSDPHPHPEELEDVAIAPAAASEQIQDIAPVAKLEG